MRFPLVRNLSISIAILLSLLQPFASVAARTSSNPKVNDTQTEAASTTMSIFNSRLAVQIGSDGRFNIGAFPDSQTGDAAPNSWDLMYRWPNAPSTSFSTVRIDGSDNVYGTNGSQIEAPTNLNSTTNESKWQIGDITVTQTIQLVLNTQTGLQDAAKITYTVKNTGSASHTVGLRAMIDTELNRNDGAVFRVPGVGLVTKETEFDGSQVPDVVDEFFNVTDSTHVAASTFKSNGATAPDRLVLAGWPHLRASLYDYSVDPSYDFANPPSGDNPDSAYAAYWNPVSLTPGSTRTLSTMYGLAQLTANLQPPLSLGVTGPASLSVTGSNYSPNPFEVTAILVNSGTSPLTNVQVALNLPSGLSLASGQSSITVGTLAAGEERDESWSVRASTQASARTLSYSVTASAANEQTKSVQRQISIPALTGSCQVGSVQILGSAALDGDVSGPGCNVTVTVVNPNPWWTHYSIDSDPHGDVTFGLVNASDPLAQIGVLPPSFLDDSSQPYSVHFSAPLDSLTATAAIQNPERVLNVVQLPLSMAAGTPKVGSQVYVDEDKLIADLSVINNRVTSMPDLNGLLQLGRAPTYSEVVNAMTKFFENSSEVQSFVQMLIDINMTNQAVAINHASGQIIDLLKNGAIDGAIDLLGPVAPYVKAGRAAYEMIVKPIMDFINSYGTSTTGKVTFITLSPSATKSYTNNLQKIYQCFKSSQGVGAGGYALPGSCLYGN